MTDKIKDDSVITTDTEKVTNIPEQGATLTETKKKSKKVGK